MMNSSSKSSFIQTPVILLSRLRCLTWRFINQGSQRLVVYMLRQLQRHECTGPSYRRSERSWLILTQTSKPARQGNNDHFTSASSIPSVCSHLPETSQLRNTLSFTLTTSPYSPPPTTP